MIHCSIANYMGIIILFVDSFLKHYLKTLVKQERSPAPEDIVLPFFISIIELTISLLLPCLLTLFKAY